jgi:predicted ABC-type ATPase
MVCGGTFVASKSFAPWIKELVDNGYNFRLFFVYLPNADAAVRRVSERITRGGHAVPEETSRRRYEAGLKNFFKVYQPLTTHWTLIDNTVAGKRRIIAHGRGTAVDDVFDEQLWKAANDVGSKD